MSNGESELNAFCEFASELVLENGRKLVIEPWQREILRDYFNGCFSTLILIPKKNGKTTLIAALALYHLMTVSNAYFVIVASSIKQARVLYLQAVGFIDRTPDLKGCFIVRESTKEIRSNVDRSKIEVLAADAKTADGAILTGLVVDEVHRHPSLDLMNVLKAGLRARKGQMISLSTAGSDEESAFGKMCQRGREHPLIKRNGSYRYYRSDSGDFSMHEYALDITQDHTDMELVKTASPLSSQTVEDLRAIFEDPGTTVPWWRRHHANQWVRGGEDHIITPELWDGLPRRELQSGSNVLIGMDLGWTSPTDCTALVPVGWESSEVRILGTPIILEPTGQHGRFGGMDDRAITTALLVLAGIKTFDEKAFIKELSGEWETEVLEKWAWAIQFAQPYKVAGVVLDPSENGQQLAQQIQRAHKIKMFPFEQNDTPMALADGLFMEAMRNGYMHHNGDKFLRQHALNAVERPVASSDERERFYFGRSKHGRRLPQDALRAASMAHGVLVAHEGVPKAKTTQGHWFL